jgi:hypothetical protein
MLAPNLGIYNELTLFSSFFPFLALKHLLEVPIRGKEMEATSAVEPAVVAEPVGQGLLAMMEVHANPPATERVVNELEQVVAARRRAVEAASQQSRQMAEMYLKISELLELLHERMMQERSLSLTISQGFEQMEQRIKESEERQIQTLEETLKHWSSERKLQNEERMVAMESYQVHAQMEVNRLLRIMWLGTGLAAAGAGLALVLQSN